LRKFDVLFVVDRLPGKFHHKLVLNQYKQAGIIHEIVYRIDGLIANLPSSTAIESMLAENWKWVGGFKWLRSFKRSTLSRYWRSGRQRKEKIGLPIRIALFVSSQIRTGTIIGAAAQCSTYVTVVLMRWRL
jgi:hypothetical protein